MLMQDACRLAADAGAEQLWLTHYSPACPAPWLYEAELKKIFPNVVITKDGRKIEIKE
jgi:ribonuclease Z